MTKKKLTDYDTYLFDWDGTLARTLDVWLETMRSQLAKFDVTASDKEIVLKMFGDAAAGAKILGISDDNFEPFMAELTILAPQIVANVDLYEDVAELLNNLKKQGKKLALITASRRETVEAAGIRHGILDLFDVMVSGSEITKHKPDPESLNMALEALQMTPKSAVMLGDSDKDLLAAERAGVDSVLFFPAEHELFHTRAELDAHKPTFTVASWRELITLLQGGNEA